MLSQAELETEDKVLLQSFGLPPTPRLKCKKQHIFFAQPREKTKILLGTQSNARAGWPKRLRLVQATP